MNQHDYQRNALIASPASRPHLSVAYTFEPTLIDRLADFKQVYEIYGKLDKDIIGGGRSTYTLAKTSPQMLRESITHAHKKNIQFNYLLNGAFLDGSEQTKSGYRRIRTLLDFICDCGIDSVTVASPFLLGLVNKQYPHLTTRISVFATIDTASKARQWQDLGADTLCVSAISCNRNFQKLKEIRAAVSCKLQLIVNACCLPHCAWELTHMNLLTSASKTKSKQGSFSFDYCFLHCSSKRLEDPLWLIKAIWIRPEDLHIYESLGYDYFKIVERSCPTDLLITRVKSYSQRSFDGNLYELIAPIAQIKKELKPSRMQHLRMLASFAKPWKMKISSLLAMKQYAEKAIPHQFYGDKTPVYIDNKGLDGFISALMNSPCSSTECKDCMLCQRFADKTVRIDPLYQKEILSQASQLKEGLFSGSLWE